MVNKLALRYDGLVKASDSRIAATRTIAPMIWAVLSEFVLDTFGIEIADGIAKLDGSGGLQAEQATSIAVGLMFAVIYLGGKRFPKLEKALLGVKVDSQSYTASEAN